MGFCADDWLKAWPLNGEVYTHRNMNLLKCYIINKIFALVLRQTNLHFDTLDKGSILPKSFNLSGRLFLDK